MSEDTIKAASTATAETAEGAVAADAAPVVKSVRQEVLKKSDLQLALQPVIEKILGQKVSKVKVWELFKASFAVPFEVTAKDGKNLSLSGVGLFEIISSQRSVAVGKPALRPRFRPSTRLTDILNGDKEFVEGMLSKAGEEGDGEGEDKVEAPHADEAAPGEVAATPAPTATAAPAAQSDLI